MHDVSDASAPTRIGIECESLEGDVYGVARLTLKLLEQLAARPELARTHRFVLYFNRRIPDLPLLASPVFEPRRVGLPRWGLPGSFSLYYYLLLPLALWRARLTAVYYPNYMLPLIHPPHVPSLVVMTEDIYREAANPKLAFRYRLAYRIFSLFWAARRATRIMAISRASRDALAAEGIAPARIVVNELAVEPPRAVAPTDGRFLLWVGQAFPRRHLKEALQAFGDIAAEMPDLAFRIVGPDKYDPPFLRDMADDINRRLGREAVLWEPRVDDTRLAAHYAGAAALVYVSDTEAFGLPPLEALSYGAVPVVADTPVSREVYGDRACYAADASPGTIAGAIRQALADTHLRDGIRADAPAILARYTWSAHADRWLNAIRTLPQ